MQILTVVDRKRQHKVQCEMWCDVEFELESKGWGKAEKNQFE